MLAPVVSVNINEKHNLHCLAILNFHVNKFTIIVSDFYITKVKRILTDKFLVTLGSDINRIYLM